MRSTRRRQRQTSPDARRLHRRQEMLRVLLDQRGRPLPVEDLARLLGVSERTIERDLEALRAARLPLRGRGGTGGGVWFHVAGTTAPLRLDDDQVMALLLMLDALGTALPTRLVDTREELRRHLDDPRLF